MRAISSKSFFYCIDYVEIFRESGLWVAYSLCHKPVAKLNTTISFNSSILSNVFDTMPEAKTIKKTKLNKRICFTVVYYVKI